MAQMTIADSEKGSRIPQQVREQMSICPPPLATPEGDLLYYGDDYVQRYKDLAAMKAAHLLYIEDALDDSEDYHTTTKYRMLIRCMSCDADLQVIMAAAKHLDLVSSYTIKRGEVDGLDPSLEMNYCEVFYTIGNTTVRLDEDVLHTFPLVLSQKQRKDIWCGLFRAAGYRPVYGNAINIKRKNL